MKVYIVNINNISIPDSVLSHFPNRLEQSKHFYFPEDQKRSLCAGALLYSVLGLEDDDIFFVKNKKPASNKTPLEFNLSHSGDYVVLAVDENPVGVDIELADERHFSVAKRVYTNAEILWMNDDIPKRFNTLWTLKESVMKITGKGMALPPESFEVLPLINSKSITISGVEYYGATTFVDDYALSVCSTLPIPNIELISISKF